MESANEGVENIFKVQGCRCGGHVGRGFEQLLSCGVEFSELAAGPLDLHRCHAPVPKNECENYEVECCVVLTPVPSQFPSLVFQSVTRAPKYFIIQAHCVRCNKTVIFDVIYSKFIHLPAGTPRNKTRRCIVRVLCNFDTVSTNRRGDFGGGSHLLLRGFLPGSSLR